MKYVYNKLVRDKIPEEINKMKGRKTNYKILNDDEYLQELDKKLFEEAHEFIEEHSVEELADLMEVISAIIKLRNISLEDVERARKIKNNKTGGYILSEWEDSCVYSYLHNAPDKIVKRQCSNI